MSALADVTPYFSALILFGAVLFFFVQWRLTDVEMRSRLSRLEFKLDLLLRHAGVEFSPYQGLSPEIVDALQRGKKIEAIKRYRQVSGAGLREAKDFIEDVQRRSGDAS